MFASASSLKAHNLPGGVVPTGLDVLDRVLGGGIPKGSIATIEGGTSSGRWALGAGLFRQAQREGLTAITGGQGAFAVSLQAAGVDLDRLLLVEVEAPLAIARSADILLRSGAFGVVAVPAIALPQHAWTRLGMLAHRTGTALLALGARVPQELTAFATLRIGLHIERVFWEGESGLFCALAGYDVRATVLKHKRAIPGASVLLTMHAFEGFCDADHLRSRSFINDHHVAVG